MSSLIRTPVSAPARSSAYRSGATARTPKSGASDATSPRPSSSANSTRPGRSASSSSAHTATSRRPIIERTSEVPPTRPLSGDATMFRTRSCEGDGSSPISASLRANFSVSVTARSCTLPREVSSIDPLPSSAAQCASTCSCADVSRPPGNRTRASAPSAAWCVDSAPGHLSGVVRGAGELTHPGY